MKTLRSRYIRFLHERKERQIYEKFTKSAEAEHEAVGWLSKQRQHIRFSYLLKDLDITSSSILDFGCGYGALYAYMQNDTLPARYSGIDLLKKPLAIASKRFPNAHFIHTSICDVTDCYDYIFSSGVYAFCTKELFLLYVTHACSLARREYRFNLLLNTTTNGYFHISKKELEQIIATLHIPYTLRYGYLENDITVYLKTSDFQ